jgi:hypothetical protein
VCACTEVLKASGTSRLHERGDAFKQYKETLRPLVEPERVIFGNTVPIKVLG